jgi:predicted SAM-dependent methyltransferase
MVKILKKAIKLFLYFFAPLSNSYRSVLFHTHRYFVCKKYLKNNKSKRLHIGAGSVAHVGWLGSDLTPKIGKGIIYIDASKKLPFDDNSFDYIYSEHMIEHISYESATYMLNECNRILKKDGKIRISTPDLDQYLSLFEPGKSKIQEDFITYMKKNWLKKFDNDANLPYHILNLNMHAWGHTYIYCKTTLKQQLINTNFSKIQDYKNNESSDSTFVDLEMHANTLEKQMLIEDAVRMVNYESMNLEASKKS